jgi:hypothetical protein
MFAFLASRRAVATTLASLAAVAMTLALAPAAASAACPLGGSTIKPKKFFKNRLPVEVEVEYLATKGHTAVDASGITYHVNGQGPKKGTIYYPEPYWYDAYALYLIGQPMTFKVRIKNKKRRVIRNLQVVAVQEYLNYFGKDGEDLPGCPTSTWTIKKLGRHQVWEGIATITVPAGTQPGLDQTHVQIQRKLPLSNNRLLYDAPQAGVYCPPEPEVVSAD